MALSFNKTKDKQLALDRIWLVCGTLPGAETVALHVRSILFCHRPWCPGQHVHRRGGARNQKTAAGLAENLVRVWDLAREQKS